MRRRPAAAIEKVRRRSARRRYLRRRLAQPARARSGRDFEFAVGRASTPKAKEKAPMDMARSEVRKLAAEDYSTTQHLEHASRQARERNYQDFSHRRRGRAPLRERILQRGLSHTSRAR